MHRGVADVVHSNFDPGSATAIGKTVARSNDGGCKLRSGPSRQCRYFQLSLSLRDIEEPLLEHGVAVMYEAIRCWCDKFGAGFGQGVV
jgi:hypothetical protein